MGISMLCKHAYFFISVRVVRSEVYVSMLSFHGLQETKMCYDGNMSNAFLHSEQFQLDEEACFQKEDGTVSKIT